MVKVYQAKVWDHFRDGLRVTRQKGTITWVSSMHGVILPDTAQDVADTCVDAVGCYREPSPPDNDAEPAAQIIVFSAQRRMG